MIKIILILILFLLTINLSINKENFFDNSKINNQYNLIKNQPIKKIKYSPELIIKEYNTTNSALILFETELQGCQWCCGYYFRWSRQSVESHRC